MKEFLQQFGGKITPEFEAVYQKSSNWKNGKFENLVETSLSISFWDIPELLYDQFSNKEQREPENPLSIIPLDQPLFMRDDPEFKFVWYGHSVVLMRVHSLTILIDPMLGSNASPIAPYKTGRFSDNTLDLIDTFPKIDLLLLSHDHYDHLDYDSIQKLASKTDLFYVALGMKRHLVKWGIAATKIQEFDWWDHSAIANLNITFTPTRHFSGRGLTDRMKSLWGGWAIRTPKQNVWFSGDGGYGKHFRDIGSKLGPFDVAFMECGQYNEKWRSIHLFPEESVQAALDAGVQKALPVHWAGFALSQHSWSEPAEQFSHYANEQKLATIFPRLGQLFDIMCSTEKWWNGIK